jgi:precorrin-8X/cobalt-precorrin-8 methylmutase
MGEMIKSRLFPQDNQDRLKIGYLDFQKPSLRDAIDSCIKDGADSIIIHPYFLDMTADNSRDIIETIDESVKNHPKVKIICTDPLGTHEKIAQVVIERINSTKIISPQDIEKESFNILSEELDLLGIPAEQIPIYHRVIHATADFEYRNTLKIHLKAIETGIKAIRLGKDILTDVGMVQAGISKRHLDRWGGKVICKVSDDEVAKISAETGKTRSEIAKEKGFTENVGIVAIGNAPTALLKIIDIMEDRTDVLVVGVPVGFVKAINSKVALANQNFPFITNLSRKGGSSVAVAIINALLKISDEK